MRKESLKNFICLFVLSLCGLASLGSAAQIRGYVSVYAPFDVNVKQDIRSVKSSPTYHSDFIWGVGAEYLVFPVGPLMVGGGAGYLSEQKDGDMSLVMPAFPLFASVGVIGPEKWTVRPYLQARIGYPLSASRDLSWWRRPLNFFASGNIGIQLPYHLGVEATFAYLTMNKYFKNNDMEFRANSFKMGGSLTVQFDLFGKSSSSEKGKQEKEDSAQIQKAEENPVPGEGAFETDSVLTTAEEASAEPVESVTEPAAESFAEDSLNQSNERSPEEALMELSAESADETVTPDTSVASVEMIAEETIQESSVENQAEESDALPVGEPEPAAEAVETPAPESAKKVTSKKKASKKSKAKAKKSSTKKSKKTKKKK